MLTQRTTEVTVIGAAMGVRYLKQDAKVVRKTLASITVSWLGVVKKQSMIKKNVISICVKIVFDGFSIVNTRVLIVVLPFQIINEVNDFIII